MTAVERINRLLTETPADQIDSSLFWRDLIEKGFGSTKPDDTEGQKYLAALQFMYLGAVLIEETREVFEPKLVLAMFQAHMEIWTMTSGLATGIKIKMVPK